MNSWFLSWVKSMTAWQAFFLGLIQGITEFLPISSSAHLALAQYFLGFSHLQDYILFDLICHLGTLSAIFLVFFPIIKETLTTNTKSLLQVFLGTLPIFSFVFFLKPIRELFDYPQLLGPCILFSASLLFASVYFKIPLTLQPNRRVWQDPLTIGIFQAVAILPGISRSGATISAAQILGWQKEQAFQFSFLLAIPAILGGSLIEGWKVWNAPTSPFMTMSPLIFAIGFVTSFLMGFFALRMLMRWLIQDKWKYFAWYCLILGVITTIYFNIR